jgi:hypothetical protein
MKISDISSSPQQTAPTIVLQIHQWFGQKENLYLVGEILPVLKFIQMHASYLISNENMIHLEGRIMSRAATVRLGTKSVDYRLLFLLNIFESSSLVVVVDIYSRRCVLTATGPA